MWKNCTPLWREAHFQVKMYKTPHGRTTFGSSHVEKLHAAVARSTFSSQNRKKLTVSDHFLKFRCGKITRRCSEKYILKSKCTKHCMFGALLEAHFEVKIVKTLHVRNIFGRSDVWTKHCMLGPFFDVPMSKNCKSL